MRLCGRFSCVATSFMTIQTTVFAMVAAVAGHAAVHGHRGPAMAAPDIARVAADAGFLVGTKSDGGSVISVALLAFEVAALHVRLVREVDVLGLARVDEPFGLTLRGHVAIDEVFFGGRGSHRGGVTGRAFIQSRDAGE